MTMAATITFRKMETVLFIQAFEFAIIDNRRYFPRTVEVKFQLSNLSRLKGEGAEDGASPGDFLVGPFFQLKRQVAAARKPGRTSQGPCVGAALGAPAKLI